MVYGERHALPSVLTETALPCLLVKKVVRSREPSLQTPRCSYDAGTITAITSNRYLNAAQQWQQQEQVQIPTLRVATV